MGKSKTRILRKGINDRFMHLSREDATQKVVQLLKDENITDAKDIISMFGLTAIEITEAGASYECITIIKGILK